MQPMHQLNCAGTPLHSTSLSRRHGVVSDASGVCGRPWQWPGVPDSASTSRRAPRERSRRGWRAGVLCGTHRAHRCCCWDGRAHAPRPECARARGLTRSLWPHSLLVLTQIIAFVVFLFFGGMMPKGMGGLLRFRSTDRDGWSPCSNACGPGIQVRLLLAHAAGRGQRRGCDPSRACRRPSAGSGAGRSAPCAARWDARREPCVCCCSPLLLPSSASARVSRPLPCAPARGGRGRRRGSSAARRSGPLAPLRSPR